MDRETALMLNDALGRIANAAERIADGIDRLESADIVAEPTPPKPPPKPDSGKYSVGVVESVLPSGPIPAPASDTAPSPSAAEPDPQPDPPKPEPATGDPPAPTSPPTSDIVPEGRALNALLAAGIETYADLKALGGSYDDIKGLGAKSAEIVREALSEFEDANPDAVPPDARTWRERTLEDAGYDGPARKILDSFDLRTLGDILEAFESIEWTDRLADAGLQPGETMQILVVIENERERDGDLEPPSADDDEAPDELAVDMDDW